jgi:aryl-alcohol dehydrogenase-like predicted oxidoreductase
MSSRISTLPKTFIFQVHDIEFAPSLDIVVNETLPALQSVVEAGKARFIGVTGYAVSVLKEAIERSNTKVDTVLSYTRDTLIDDTFKKFLPFFQVCSLLRIYDMARSV